MLRQTLSLMLLLLGCGLAGAGVLLATVWRAAGSADWLCVLAVFGGLGVLAAGLSILAGFIARPGGATGRGR